MDSLNLFAVLHRVYLDGKSETVTVEDILKSSCGHEFVDSYDGDIYISQDDINAALKILNNGGFVFKSDGYFYPTIRGCDFVSAVNCYEQDEFRFYDMPFLLLEKHALAKCESDFIGE
jgi:hypothetical protein